MTKTSTRNRFAARALAAAAAVAMLPAIAAAQTPDAPLRKPPTQERQVEARKAPPAPKAHAHKVRPRQVADRRFDRDRRHEHRHDRDGRHDRDDRRQGRG